MIGQSLDRYQIESNRFFDFASRVSTIVARGLGDIAFGITASSDGRTILYARRDSAVDDLMLVDNFR
jgi:hypothetical protein